MNSLEHGLEVSEAQGESKLPYHSAQYSNFGYLIKVVFILERSFYILHMFLLQRSLCA